MTVTISPSATIEKSCVIGTPGFSFSKGKKRKQLKSTNVIIGDNVYMASFCNVDLGTFRDTIVGDDTIIDSHVHISHDVQIGKNCEIDAGAIILGEVTIGNNSRIATNAVIHPQVTIGNNCVVGANSYLRHDIPDNSIAYGSPAKIISNTRYSKYRAS
jgi:UDP-3-O-[3-hydroxymyristoyl] glucosamine N-acyltransferase